MMGRYVLPWFGGGPAVWTNCMLFFQAMLLAGYGYAHWLGSRRSQKMQSWVHVALLAVSLAFLPLAPRAAVWKSTAVGDPSWRILLLLAVTIGGPYLLLSATTPLLQRWFHVTHPEQSPWRLYALSNLGSFLALFSYPLVLEPYFKLSMQSKFWSGLYVVFIGLCGWIAWQMRSVPVTQPADAEAPLDDGPSAIDIAMWLALAACGSVLLLGTTSQITQEIAVFPFLWVAPLSIYLLTFILTFESDRWYRRGIFAVLAGILAPVTCVAITLSMASSPWKQFAIYAAAFDSVLSDHRGGRSAGRSVRRNLRAAIFQRIQRVPDRAGGGVLTGFPRMDAQRSSRAMDRPQFFGAGPVDGADVRRIHFDLRRGNQQAAGH